MKLTLRIPDSDRKMMQMNFICLMSGWHSPHTEEIFQVISETII